MRLSMRSLLALLFISGILASCRTQQPQTQPRGTQIGQSTAPLHSDPSVPNPPNEPDTNTSAPVSEPIQSPVPLTDAGVTPPGDAGDTSAGDAGVNPPDQPKNPADPTNPVPPLPQDPNSPNPGPMVP